MSPKNQPNCVLKVCGHLVERNSEKKLVMISKIICWMCCHLLIKVDLLLYFPSLLVSFSKYIYIKKIDCNSLHIGKIC